MVWGAGKANNDCGLYGVKRNGSSHLLGGVASVLTGGRVKRVDMNSSAETGSCEFEGEGGRKVRRIVMPSPEKMPGGFGEDEMRGLLDHESAHAIWSDFVGFKPKNGLEMTVTNIIEDARIEHLMRGRFIGSKENIDAMNATMSGKMDHNGFNEAEPMRQIISTFGIGMVMGEKALETEIYDWADNADDLRAVMDVILPIGKAGARADKSLGAYTAAMKVIRAIQDLKDEPEQPKKPQEPQPEKGKKGEDEAKAPAPSSGAGDSSEAGEGEGEGEAKAGSGPKAPQGGSKGEKEPGAGAGKGEDEGKAEGGQEAQAGATGEAGEGGSEGAAPAGSGSEKGEDAEGEPAAAQAEPGNGGDNGEVSKARTRVFVKKAKEDAASGSIPGEGPVALADLAYEEVKEAIEETIQEDETAQAMIEARLIRTGLHKPTYPWSGKDREVKAPKGGEANYKAAMETIRPVVGGLRTMLRLRVLAEAKTKVRHGKEDGPMISTKTIAALATGTSDRVFASFSRGKSRKTAISLLIDGSGSMNGYPVETATRTAMALTEALRGLPSVSVEVNGFEYKSSDSVRYILKPFASKDPSGIASFLNHSGSGNDDGLAVRWAARRLMAEKADRRIMIVLSDGWPSDPHTGCGITVSDDLKSAVGACERAGIEMIGIGIVSDAVQSFYPKSVVVKKVEDLTGAVLRELGKLFDPAGAKKGKAESLKFSA